MIDVSDAADSPGAQLTPDPPEQADVVAAQRIEARIRIAVRDGKDAVHSQLPVPVKPASDRAWIGRQLVSWPVLDSFDS